MSFFGERQLFGREGNSQSVHVGALQPVCQHRQHVDCQPLPLESSEFRVSRGLLLGLLRALLILKAEGGKVNERDIS